MAATGDKTVSEQKVPPHCSKGRVKIQVPSILWGQSLLKASPAGPFGFQSHCLTQERIQAGREPSYLALPGRRIRGPAPDTSWASGWKISVNLSEDKQKTGQWPMLQRWGSAGAGRYPSLLSHLMAGACQCLFGHCHSPAASLPCCFSSQMATRCSTIKLTQETMQNLSKRGSASMRKTSDISRSPPSSQLPVPG